MSAQERIAAVTHEAIEAEIANLLRSGMPEPVVHGYMAAKVQALADQHASAQWDEVRRICDEVGEQAHQGDPVKKARVEHFNDMFVAELKKRQGL
jgi:hypothetical protein